MIEIKRVMNHKYRNGKKVVCCLFTNGHFAWIKQDGDVRVWSDRMAKGMAVDSRAVRPETLKAWLDEESIASEAEIKMELISAVEFAIDKGLISELAYSYPSWAPLWEEEVNMIHANREANTKRLVSLPF